MGEQKDSQQESQHDSGLQTPQPDQPIPSKADESRDQGDQMTITEERHTTERRTEEFDASDDVSVD